MTTDTEKTEFGLVTQSIDLASKGMGAINQILSEAEFKYLTAYRAAVCIYDSYKQSFRVIASGDQWSGDFQRAVKEIKKSTPSHCWRIKEDTAGIKTKLSYLDLSEPTQAVKYHEDVPNGREDDPTKFEIGVPLLNERNELTGVLMIDLFNKTNGEEKLTEEIKEKIEKDFEKNVTFIESARNYNKYHLHSEILNRSRLYKIHAKMKRNSMRGKPVIQEDEIKLIAEAIKAEAAAFYESSKSNPNQLTLQASCDKNIFPDHFNLALKTGDEMGIETSDGSLLEAIIKARENQKKGSGSAGVPIKLPTIEGTAILYCATSKKKKRDDPTLTHPNNGFFLYQSTTSSDAQEVLLQNIADRVAAFESMKRHKTIVKLQRDFQTLVIQSLLEPVNSTNLDNTDDVQFANKFFTLLQKSIDIRFMMIFEDFRPSTNSKDKKLRNIKPKNRIVFTSIAERNNSLSLYKRILDRKLKGGLAFDDAISDCEPDIFFEFEDIPGENQSWVLKNYCSDKTYYFVVSADFLPIKIKKLLSRLCLKCLRVMVKLREEQVDREIKVIDANLVEHIESFKGKRDSFVFDAVKPKQKTTLGLISDKFQFLFNNLLKHDQVYQTQVFCIPWPKTGLGDYVYSGTEFTSTSGENVFPYRENRLYDAIKLKLEIGTRSNSIDSETVTWIFPSKDADNIIKETGDSIFEFIGNSTVIVKIPSGFFILCIAITSMQDGLTNPFFSLSRIDYICTQCLELFRLKRRFYDLDEHVLSQPAHQLLATFAHDAAKNISIAKGKAAASFGCDSCKEVSSLLETVHETHAKILHDFEQDESPATVQHCDLRIVLQQLIEREFKDEIAFSTNLLASLVVDLPRHAVEGIHRQVLSNAINNSSNGKAEVSLQQGSFVVDGLQSAIACVTVKNPKKERVESEISRKGLGLTIGSTYNKGRFLLSNTLKDGYFIVAIVFRIKE